MAVDLTVQKDHNTGCDGEHRAIITTQGYRPLSIVHPAKMYARIPEVLLRYSELTDESSDKAHRDFQFGPKAALGATT